ncbi:C1 family peptidase [Mycobacterium sp.]|uniref:C1 family peptidase n=1 Tax=Mycobacterium sp. TaxID=1785 RepID=UPI003F97E1BF
MNARFDRRSILALAATGAVGLALPSCFSEAKGYEPDELTEYGYDPDVPEPGTVEAPGRLAKVPPAASVRAEWLPPVGRQTMPNCFVWASVYGLATFYAARKSQTPPTSPARQAGPGYAYIRSETANNIAAKTCQGGQITKCLSWLQSNGGTPSLAAAPNYLRRGSTTSCHVNWSGYGSRTIPPDPSFHIPDYKMTTITGQGGLNNLRTVIASGVPIAYGTSLYTDFARYHGSPSPYVGNGQWAQNRNGKKVGHVMLIVGYNDAYTTTTGAVRVQNSFGTGWGDNGFVWIAYNALESMAQGRGVYVPASA